MSSPSCISWEITVVQTCSVVTIPKYIIFTIQCFKIPNLIKFCFTCYIKISDLKKCSFLSNKNLADTLNPHTCFLCQLGFNPCCSCEPVELSYHDLMAAWTNEGKSLGWKLQIFNCWQCKLNVMSYGMLVNVFHYGYRTDLIKPNREDFIGRALSLNPKGRIYWFQVRIQIRNWYPKKFGKKIPSFSPYIMSLRMFSKLQHTDVLQFLHKKSCYVSGLFVFKTEFKFPRRD